jgi:hypothetical protein
MYEMQKKEILKKAYLLINSEPYSARALNISWMAWGRNHLPTSPLKNGPFRAQNVVNRYSVRTPINDKHLKQK